MEPKFTISALIIDDDLFSREQLKDLLGRYAKQIEIKQLCDSGTSGIQAINKWQPDLVFLDIEMPDMSGFDMLKKLPVIESQVIFTTAYDQYAIRAIRFAALDYLLKPIDAVVLQEAVSRAIETIQQKRYPVQLKHLLMQVDNLEKTLDNLAIPTVEGLLFVQLIEIVRCESDDKYTRIFLTDKKMILASRTLGDFEELLEPSGFIRIHKSHLINAKHLKKYIRGEGGQVVMDDGAVLDVSRRKKEALLQKVSRL